jgi:hypothetical protein
MRSFHQLALAGDAVPIAQQQNAQQQLGIDRGPTALAVTVSQSLLHQCEADVFIDQSQQTSFRNLIFQKEVVEPCFAAFRAESSNPRS